MATLTRLKPPSVVSDADLLQDSVPAPFPVALLRKDVPRLTIDDSPTVQCEFSIQADAKELLNNMESVRASGANMLDDGHLSVPREETDELISSLSFVQHSCLMTLNNLLSGSEIGGNWQPIVPTRRHSMPSRAQSDNSPIESSSSALHTLLSNLRNYDTTQMSSTSSSSFSDDSAVLSEIQRRIQDLSPLLPQSDAQLAQAITSFLAHLHRLTSIDPNLSGSLLKSSSVSSVISRSPVDLYGELSRQVMDLQTRRLDRHALSSQASDTPQRTVEVALLWSRIDQELETVFDLCLQRNQSVPVPYSPEQQPPEYNELEPPEYEFSYTGEKEKSPTTQHSQSVSNEKVKMDLEAVTMAIDRLYMVAPQLHNQRVELKKTKLEELERARLAGPTNKGKEKDEKELYQIIDMLGKASRRRLDDQSVTLGDRGMKDRMVKAQQRENAKRDAFVEQLVEHSSIRRITSQDALLVPNRTKSSEALLSLPEFIREDVPSHMCQELDPDVMLTLPDFIKEELLHEPKILPPPPPPRVLSKKKSQKLKQRSRSYSAPPLAWLIPSLGRSGTPSKYTQAQKDDSQKVTKPMTVRYVAEHHEHLQHLLVFVGVDEGMTPGCDLEAEVLPIAANFSSGDRLLLRCGPAMSEPLKLPMHVLAGKKDVRVQSGHYEIKIPTNFNSNDVGFSTDDEDARLLDATQLKSMDPISFICSSCSLVLVQAGGSDNHKLEYRDLPSEYWSELLEAWMCHSDQRFHDQISKNTRDGIWPRPGQALVGGSYVLFEESAVVKINVRVSAEPCKDEDAWSRVTCICGAVIGRRRLSSPEAGISHPLSIYRMPKYAFRPVSPTCPPCRTPFSAFILEDMMEHVHAHASYRFLILDEEEEKPRLLIWLFKPKMRLAYATTAQYALPQSGVVNVAKVLFKILGPDVSQNVALDDILSKYPGFPQAERLSYPISICHRLAALLKESNTSYPIGMRVMTGLLVGWLLRS